MPTINNYFFQEEKVRYYHKSGQTRGKFSFLPVHYLPVLVSCFKKTHLSITHIRDQIHTILIENFTQISIDLHEVVRNNTED